MSAVVVGSKSFFHSSTSAVTCSVTDLLDEVGNVVTLLENDLLVVNLVYAGVTERIGTDLNCTGFTRESSPIYSDDTYDTCLLVQYKVMGSSPDVDITVPAVLTGDAIALTIYVVRGANQTTPGPFVVGSSGTNTGVMSFPIANVPYTGAVAIVGAGCAGVAADPYVPYTNRPAFSSTHFKTATTESTRQVQVATAFFDIIEGGSQSPPSFGGGPALATNSWASFIAIIIPEESPAGSFSILPANILGRVGYEYSSGGTITQEPLVGFPTLIFYTDDVEDKLYWTVSGDATTELALLTGIKINNTFYPKISTTYNSGLDQTAVVCSMTIPMSVGIRAAVLLLLPEPGDGVVQFGQFDLPYSNYSRISGGSDIFNDLVGDILFEDFFAGISITSTTEINNTEGTTLAHVLMTDASSPSFSIVGGADQARLEISGSTLRWASNGTKSYDSPDDTDTNNTYVVIVRLTSGSRSVDQTITVTVTSSSGVFNLPNYLGALADASYYVGGAGLAMRYVGAS